MLHKATLPIFGISDKKLTTEYIQTRFKTKNISDENTINGLISTNDYWSGCCL